MHLTEKKNSHRKYKVRRKKGIRRRTKLFMTNVIVTLSKLLRNKANIYLKILTRLCLTYCGHAVHYPYVFIKIALLFQNFGKSHICCHFLLDKLSAFKWLNYKKKVEKKKFELV